MVTLLLGTVHRLGHAQCMLAYPVVIITWSPRPFACPLPPPYPPIAVPLIHSHPLTAVECSAANIRRQMAKSVAKSGLAKRCWVQLSYAIGVAKPLSHVVAT